MNRSMMRGYHLKSEKSENLSAPLVSRGEISAPADISSRNLRRIGFSRRAKVCNLLVFAIGIVYEYRSGTWHWPCSNMSQTQLRSSERCDRAYFKFQIHFKGEH